MKRQIFLFATLLLFALAASAFQRGSAEGANPKPYSENHWKMLALVRQINTCEAGEVGQYGSYSPWPVLLTHHPEEFKSWLTQNGVASFGGPPEVISGSKLRLDVNANGHGYAVLVEDSDDKQGFAFVSDERGFIREGKFIH